MEANLGFGNVVLCMFLLLLPLSCEAIGTSRPMQEVEVEKHLKRLNKPAVKSIKSADGDVIDCVNILNQPAFDHPDLKNHKIQMRPSSYPKGMTFKVSNMSSNSKPLRQLWQKSGSCPEGTVPIRRTKKDDLIRAESFKKFGKKDQGSFPEPVSEQPPPSFFSWNMTHEHAVVFVEGDDYYGAKAGINVWSPRIEHYREFSLAQIWVVGGPSRSKDLNTIEAGWMVYPKIFGGHEPRLFTYWTRDKYASTGCYNLDCPGFVHTSQNIALGAMVLPDSIYGSNQYFINLTIWKDKETKNWWLAFDKEHIGYWPASLFTYLKDGVASRVEWGGEVLNSKFGGQHTATQMGSGHFPYEGFRKASYFKTLEVVDDNNELIPSRNLYTIATPNKNCYGIRAGTSQTFGRYFYYSGPGRNPNCP